MLPILKKISLVGPLALLLALSLSPHAMPRAGAAVITDDTHDPDTEAEEVRRARLAEMIDHELNPGAFDDTVAGDTATPAPNPTTPAPVNNCKYVSGISTAPPSMKVALTFDDGPTPEATPYILETLQKYGVHATFFMIGESAAKNPDLVQKVVSAGHLIVGNHSWTHPDFHTIPVAQQTNEVVQNETLLGKDESPKLFRYPYGNSTCETNALVHGKGYKIVGWHVDSCDWAYNATGTVGATDAKLCAVAAGDVGDFQAHVVNALLARKGGILLMHEIQPNTIKQLDEILAKLVHEGFSFGTLDEADFQSSLR